jgi:ketosteroid isomerase-like protein
MIVWRGGTMSDLISQVKALYAAFSRGDIATILASVADDISWEFEGPPEILSAGIRDSPREVAEYFSALAAQSVDHHLEMSEFLATGDAVAAFGRYQGTVKSSGIRVDTPVAHYFKFRDGRVIRHIQLTNTAATLEAIRGHGAAATS